MSKTAQCHPLIGSNFLLCFVVDAKLLVFLWDTRSNGLGVCTASLDGHVT